MGQLFTTVMGRGETDGEATIFNVQGPKGASFPTATLAGAAVGFWVLDGSLRVTLDGSEQLLVPGDFAYAPPGCRWSYTMASHFTRVHVIASPSAFDDFLAAAGEPYPYYVFPSPELPEYDRDQLAATAASYGIEFV